jgi:hypothetical protein
VKFATVKNETGVNTEGNISLDIVSMLWGQLDWEVGRINHGVEVIQVRGLQQARGASSVCGPDRLQGFQCAPPLKSYHCRGYGH